MKYRILGKTNIKVSEIGLGCEHLDRKPYEQVKATIDEALGNGVNFLDCFMPGKVIREDIIKALGNKRNDIVIQGAIGSTDVRQQYDISRDMPTVKTYFDDMLRIFGYVDIAMMFNVDSEKDYQAVFSDEYLGYAESLKKKGDIRHIGFSTHHPSLAIKAIETGLIDVLFFSLNPAFDMLPPEKNAVELMFEGFDPTLMHGIDPVRAELYKMCQQKDISITVMKALGGGKFISPELTPFEQPLSVPQCIHYALTRPAVASVLLGCQTVDEVKEAMEYYTVSDSERDYTPFLGAVRSDFRGQCVYCNHCQPCPVDIDIAAVMKYLDVARLTPDAVPQSLQSDYLSLTASGSDCTSCGSCEERCPFGVSIMMNMAEACRISAKKG
ncbi:MAG: aldo/keto reductase [Oscillospiraceae bacterium]|nr:aldo/keto reductase [Oscillospiraceae bacterium]